MIVTMDRKLCFFVAANVLICLSFYVSTNCATVFNHVPTVTKARCYANCITMVNEAGSIDPGCQGQKCLECVSPCDRTFTILENCTLNCGKSTICQQSCQFIAAIKKWPNILKGDSSTTQFPGVPAATAKNITSLTLSWEPSVNVKGSVVYLLVKRFTGDASGLPAGLPLIFLGSKAVLSVRDVCLFIPSFRTSWDGLTFFFKVVALTENSTLTEGKESAGIVMIKPDPVTSVAGPWFSYDASSIGDKLKLTVSVTPAQSQTSLISQYAMMWRMAFCKPLVVPRSSTSKGASTSISIHLYQKLKKCEHTLMVYSLVQCIASPPKVFTYTYKGCRFVDNYNKSLCFSFDPPPTPDGARAVRNLTNTEVETTPDYRFNTRVTWLPPTFPYGSVNDYFVQYGDINSLFFGLWIPAKTLQIKTTLVDVKDQLPNVVVRFRKNNNGGDNSVYHLLIHAFSVRTLEKEAVPHAEILVQNVKIGVFLFSSVTLFTVRISWDKPTFKYSSITGYRVSYIKGNNAEKTSTTSNTSIVLNGLEHSEPLKYKITPIYKHAWIKPNATVGKTVAPAPANQDVIVNGLTNQKFAENQSDNTYTANFTWGLPNLRYKPINHYKVSYVLSGYPGRVTMCPPMVSIITGCLPATTKNTYYVIPNILPKEHVTIKVTPVFSNSLYFTGSPVTQTTDAPHPREELVTVRILIYEATVTRTIKIYWEQPLFRQSAVSYYKVKYVLKNSLHSNKGSGSITVENRIKARHFEVPELNNGYKMEVQVTPVFAISLITGQPTLLVVNPSAISFCNGRKEGLYADPADCSRFYQCDANEGTNQKTCSYGRYWNNAKTACDWSKNVQCLSIADGTFCCAGSPNGDYRDPIDCGKYYTCSKGLTYHLDCPVGLHFNRKTKECDDPKNVAC